MSKLAQLINGSENITDYETKISDFHDAYGVINEEIFGGTLPSDPDIRIASMQRYRALYINGRYVFDDVFETKKLFINIVFHEMIHSWQHQEGHSVAHGPSFYKWRPLVESYGLKLNRNL